MSKTAWGGRFSEEPSALFARFSESVGVDARLAAEDVRGSIAHARMLGARGILTPDDVAKIVAGLEQIAAEIDRGEIAWDPTKEDVHMNVEALLTARIGDAGARLHTARSRNDQVATDVRLWTKAACESTCKRIDALIAVLAVRARGTLDVLMPGYTHLQRAQPVRLAHHLLAWCEMLDRDRGRLDDARARMDESPLGAGALAATTFPIDRVQTAHELGFARPARNSLDATGDRDFLAEVLAGLAICSVHLSRIAEELVLWSAQEFGYVQMSDAFTSGSSMMPQKKNPDVAELVRGKTGRVVGDLVALLVLMKGLPLAYNRDLQEDKPPTFDAFDTVDACLDVLAPALATARFDESRMRAALREGFLDATEIADWLAARGVPFREAHHVAGALVREALSRGCTLAELPDDALRAAHPKLDASVRDALVPETIVERRDVDGGPARARVAGAVEELVARLAERGADAASIAAAHGALSGPR